VRKGLSVSDQQKSIKDEDLDKVSGGGVTDPIEIERTPVDRPSPHESGVRTPVTGEHRIPPP
jgi:hypothetical protein